MGILLKKTLAEFPEEIPAILKTSQEIILNEFQKESVKNPGEIACRIQVKYPFMNL